MFDDDEVLGGVFEKHHTKTDVGNDGTNTPPQCSNVHKSPERM